MDHVVIYAIFILSHGYKIQTGNMYASISEGELCFLLFQTTDIDTSPCLDRL